LKWEIPVLSERFQGGKVKSHADPAVPAGHIPVMDAECVYIKFSPIDQL